MFSGNFSKRKASRFQGSRSFRVAISAIAVGAGALFSGCVQTANPGLACVGAGLYASQEACQIAGMGQGAQGTNCVMTTLPLTGSAKTVICWKPQSIGTSTSSTTTAGPSPTPNVNPMEALFQSYPYPEYWVTSSAVPANTVQRFNGNHFCRRSGNPAFTYSCYQATTLAGASQYAAMSSLPKAVTIGVNTVYEKESPDGLQICQYIPPLATAQYYCFQKQ